MARIRGTITDPNGPVAGVQVTVTPAGGGAAIILMTDAQGIYETAANLPPGGYAVAVVAPQGFQNPAVAQVQAQAGNQPTVQDFPLAAAAAQPQPGSIAGAVTDQANAPVANAAVTATDAAGAAQPAVQTNAAGNYRIPNLPAGNYGVGVQAAGFQNAAPIQVAVVAGQQAAQNFQLQPAAPQPGSIAGVVTDQANAPVANAAVTAIDAAGAAQPAVQTNAGGNYLIPNLPAGNYDVGVQAAGFQNAAPVQVAVAAGQQAAQNFQLQPAPAQPQVGAIAGRVAGPNNAGVPGAQVIAAPVGGGAGPAPAQSDNAGNYAIANVPPGQYNVLVVAPQGFQNPAAVQVVVVAGQQAAQQFQLQAVAAQPAGSITGLVTAPNAAGQNVGLLNVAVTATLVGGAALAPVQTDGQGRYTIVNVPAGNYVVRAQVAGALAPIPGAAQNPAEQQVVVGAGQAVLNFQLPGDPVAGFLVDLFGPAFDIETPVSLAEAGYAAAFFRIVNLILAGLTEAPGTTDVFGSQRVAGVADQLGISETTQVWRDTLADAQQLKVLVRDLVGIQSVQRLKKEAKRQFNLGLDNSVPANAKFPVLFRRFVDIATDPILTMDIAEQDTNNPQADKTEIGKADALLRELKDVVVQLVRSLSKEGQAQTRIDTEGWVPVAQRAMTIAGRLAPVRNTGDDDDKNPWAVVSVMTNKNRDTEVTPYVVLSRHGGRLLELAVNMYDYMNRANALTTFDSRALRGVFQDPRAKAVVPRAFFTDQIREQATYVKNYPVPNWA